MMKQKNRKFIRYGVVAVAIIIVILLIPQSPEEEFEKLVEFESTSISPSTDLFSNAAQITKDETATITVDVKSISQNYQNNAVVVTSFVHTEASKYMKINEPQVKVGTLSRPGATSGPLNITITGVDEPGKSYTATIKVDLNVGGNIHDSRQYDITIGASQ